MLVVGVYTGKPNFVFIFVIGRYIVEINLNFNMICLAVYCRIDV